MKKSTPHESMSPLSRREMLKSAAAGIGLAILPGAVLAAKTVKPAMFAPSVAMGYWQHPKTVDLNQPDDVVVDASTVSAGAGGIYKLHVLRAVCNAELAVEAQYQAADHRFWRSWKEGGLLQHSPTSAIHWSAKDRRALQLTIWTGSSAAATQVPAFGGTYVLAIGPNAQRLPAWSDLALDQTKRNDPRSLQLVMRGGTRVSFPYLIFGVQQTAV